MLEKDKDNFPSHLNYDLLELPTELFQVSKKNKKALAELGSDSKRMNSGLKKKGKSEFGGYPCPSPFSSSFRVRFDSILFHDNLYESLQCDQHSKTNVVSNNDKRAILSPLTSLMALFLSFRQAIHHTLTVV